MKAGWISGWAVLALGGTAAMATPSYTAVFLPTDGLTGTYAKGIASNGHIVGYSTSPARALVWQSPYSAPVSLIAFGSLSAQALATDGTLSVGYASTSTANDAALWDTNGDLTDLSPTGYVATAIYGIASGQEVGVGLTSSTPNHALLWNGGDPNAVDLNPVGYSTSAARGTNGSQQVGYGVTTINGRPSEYQALLWSGTTTSAQNITPAGYGEAQAFAISGNLVAGTGSPAVGQTDALLWNIGTGTYTDLGLGVADAIAGNYEAGYRFEGVDHAMVWSGSADSAIDLNTYLPSSLQSDFCDAFGVDQYGDVVGEVDTHSGAQAVIWIVPEPAMLSVCTLVLLLLPRSKKNQS